MQVPAPSSRLTALALALWLASAGSVSAQEDESGVPAGADLPSVILYVPAGDEAAAERAFRAALPFAGGQAIASVLPLRGALPPEDDATALVGLAGGPCPAAPAMSFEELAARAEDATTSVEIDRALAEVEEAERVLACFGATPSQVGRLVAVRALAAWLDGRRADAAASWRELYSLQPERTSDAEIPPDAQAAQLAAKTEEGVAPSGGAILWALPAGWSASVDGEAVRGDRSAVAAGRRVLRIDVPGGTSLGGVAVVSPGATALVGTRGAIDGAISAGRLDEGLVAWLALAVGPQVEREGARAALLVDLGTEPPAVWRLLDGGHLLLTPVPGSPDVGVAAREGGHRTADPRTIGSVVLGGGLAASAVGIILASVAHRDGYQLDMQSVDGFNQNHEAYESARTRERVGVGLGIGGGVVAAAGSVVVLLPSPRRQPAAVEEP